MQLSPVPTFKWIALISSLSLLSACRPHGDIYSQPQLSPAPTPAVSTSEPANTSAFNGQRAFAYLSYQVSLGPRPAGSDASRRLRQDISQRLQGWGYEVKLQDFTANTPRGPLDMSNICASLKGQSATPVLLLGAHYDTKYFQESSFVGANDGASGVAVLMELAQILAEKPLRHSLELVFFDGEEALENWSDEDSLYGSRHFAAELQRQNRTAEIGAAFVVDMVGDKDLQVTDEILSDPELRHRLYDAALKTGQAKYFPRSRRQAIDDDHLPLLRLGIPAVDIIAFYNDLTVHYPDYWHTSQDTLDKVSAQSLQAVGDTLLQTLRTLDEEWL